jgi:hypothetical protein
MALKLPKLVRIPAIPLNVHYPFGSGFWNSLDYYHVNDWELARQPVIYLGNSPNGDALNDDAFNGDYTLLRRLADYVWLSRDPRNKYSSVPCSLSLLIFYWQLCSPKNAPT